MFEGGAIFKDPFASRILDEQTTASLNEMAAYEASATAPPRLVERAKRLPLVALRDDLHCGQHVSK
jgi:hypothetical protein